MGASLFAGISVADFDAAKGWYARLFGSEPSFLPHDTEAVWELAEDRYVFILEDAARAGNAHHTIFVDELDPLIAQIAERGLEPTTREEYANGVRKATFRDADGNEIGFGGGPP